ncbi:MAG: extracellular solute-binding protein [Treponema sp.]|nr:extracellular solute-binding protein [Spirochaetia bacterium]MDD7013761.1 extracellular solute-binding protein [Spirochaetales bacterium]MDY4902871.1 extracellular solute-binding protein [Treponema sp.]
MKKLLLIAGAVLASTMIFTMSGCKEKQETLNLLVWEGYADPLFTKEFEETYNVKVNGTYFNTSDDLVAKLKAGGGKSYDLISPSGDMAGFLVQSDMVEPIDISQISNWKDINPTVILDDVEKDGQIYGVPYLWGPDYLIYDADVISEEPDSWEIFWDPAYAGKISLYDDISNIYLIGQMLGLDAVDKTALYNMTDSQLSYAKDELLKLNPAVRKYWVSAGELSDLFANKEVAVAVGWPLTVNDVNAKGRNLKWTIPKEGCTGWMDRLMIVKGALHKDLAMKYLDYITSPKGQALSSEATLYCVVNPKAKEYESPELQEATYINDLDTFFSKINFWQYVEERDKYNDIWTEVKTN